MLMEGHCLLKLPNCVLVVHVYIHTSSHPYTFVIHAVNEICDSDMFQRCSHCFSTTPVVGQMNEQYSASSKSINDWPSLTVKGGCFVLFPIKLV